MQLRLAWNSPPSSLCLLSAGITGENHHAQQVILLKVSKWQSAPGPCELPKTSPAFYVEINKMTYQQDCYLLKTGVNRLQTWPDF
jgi:hypothetical protein